MAQIGSAGTSGIGCSRALTTASSSTAMAGSRSLSECSQYAAVAVARDRSCTLARLTALFGYDRALLAPAGTHRRQSMFESVCIGFRKSYKGLHASVPCSAPRADSEAHCAAVRSRRREIADNHRRLCGRRREHDPVRIASAHARALCNTTCDWKRATCGTAHAGES